MYRSLIYGLGRMGITHLAHTQGYMLSKGFDCEFDVIDPSYSLLRRRPLRKNIKFIRDVNKLKEIEYDFAFITSPPGQHDENFKQAINCARQVFIEKPAKIKEVGQWRSTSFDRSKKIYVGYVLRKNACVQKLKQICQGLDDYEIHIDVASNIGLTDLKGWRSRLSSGGGCFNEFGSHVINLFQFLCPQEVKSLSSTKMEDASFSVENDRGRLSGNWLCDVRKSIYTVTIIGKNETFHSDLQFVNSDKGYYFNPRILNTDLPYYMRGLDFAVQSKDFLEGKIQIEDFYDALRTDDLMSGATE